MTVRAGRSASSRKIGNAIQRGLRHPTWLGETVRAKLRVRAERRRRFSVDDYGDYLGDVRATMAAAYGVSDDQYEELRSRVKTPPRSRATPWGAGEHVLGLTGAIVLLRRPRMVLETGVAAGFTTATILAALETNRTGRLHSIDLPALQVDAARFTGQVVEDDLRVRWTLHVGPSRAILPSLAREVAPIDLFVHDADHSYTGQYEEFRTVWPHLAVHGALIADDVSNPALLDFAKEVGERPYLVAKPGASAAVGLLVKSP